MHRRWFTDFFFSRDELSILNCTTTRELIQTLVWITVAKVSKIQHRSSGTGDLLHMSASLRIWLLSSRRQHCHHHCCGDRNSKTSAYGGRQDARLVVHFIRLVCCSESLCFFARALTCGSELQVSLLLLHFTAFHVSLNPAHDIRSLDRTDD